MLRIISLLACALTLAGCGMATRLAYNQSGELAYWWIDGYVDVNSQQGPRLREELASLLQWHRKTQLPLYADALQKLQPLAAGNLTEAQACAVADEVRDKLMHISTQVEPTAAWLAASLTPQQIEHLQRKYEKNSKEYSKDWSSLAPDELRKKRIKQARSRSEMLYGRLDAEQMAVLESTVDKSDFDAEATHFERQRRQRDTLQTLRKIAADKPSAAETQALIRALLDRNLNSPNPAYRALQHAQWREACASFAKVHNSTTPAQRTKALETLKEYETDFRVLAAKKS